MLRLSRTGLPAINAKTSRKKMAVINLRTLQSSPEVRLLIKKNNLKGELEFTYS